MGVLVPVLAASSRLPGGQAQGPHTTAPQPLVPTESRPGRIVAPDRRTSTRPPTTAAQPLVPTFQKSGFPENALFQRISYDFRERKAKCKKKAFKHWTRMYVIVHTSDVHIFGGMCNNKLLTLY